MKKYGLIGYPLGHSFSKKYFEEKFINENLESYSFELFPLKSIEEFPALIQSQQAATGLAVTIPYKQSVMPFLTAIDTAAMQIGAVNCIKIIEKKTYGFNTDQLGFEQTFLPLLQVHHTMALILGTGGSSAAVQYILQKNSIPFLLVSRSDAGKENTITYKQIDEKMMQKYSIIINCTPAGMYPQENDKPHLPYHLLTSKHLLYDLIYNPPKTAFLKEGEVHGCVIKNGLEMLVLQAEENWKIWEKSE